MNEHQIKKGVLIVTKLSEQIRYRLIIKNNDGLVEYLCFFKNSKFNRQKLSCNILCVDSFLSFVNASSLKLKIYFPKDFK